MNKQQKVEKQIRMLKAQVKTLTGHNNSIKQGTPNNAIESLEKYLSRKDIVKSFGVTKVLNVTPATYTRKTDNQVVQCQKAILSNGKAFLVTENRFWMEKQ